MFTILFYHSTDRKVIDPAIYRPRCFISSAETREAARRELLHDAAPHPVHIVHISQGPSYLAAVAELKAKQGDKS